MSAQILPPITAGINPEQFTDNLIFSRTRRIVFVILTIFLVIGFGLRVHNLGAESLGEDELNKLQTANEYRENGISGKNGEHPFLMKGMQTLSLTAWGKINELSAARLISEDGALRFPVAVFGTFTTLIIFLLVSELFGRSIGLVAAALWAVEPMAVGFDRIAKEDSLVLFFFLLMLFFWIRGQTIAERGGGNGTWYVWAAAAAFAALMASKYYPWLLAVPGAYYGIFLRISERKWDMGKKRYLIFFAIMGVTFVILNPTIVLTDTWREMLKFSSENRVGHDSYEYLGQLYPHKLTLWLAGVPWTFYYVFIAVKTSLSTLALFLIGLPLLFKRKLGDGRFLLFFWAFLWFVPFSVAGGKFTRYFTIVEPLVLISAAVGFCFSLRWLTVKLFSNSPYAPLLQIILFAALIAFPLYNSLAVTPHFRLFTNSLGGGMAAAGSYFPHDEFYDAATRDLVATITAKARPGALVACETPELFAHYARKIGRNDLTFVSLSDKPKVMSLTDGDYIVLTKGRRYFSNTAYEEVLKGQAIPMAEIEVAGVLAAKIYQMDEATLAYVHSLAK